MRPNKMTWLAVAALLAAAPAFAQTAQTNMSGLKLSGDKPIQIESDKLEVRQEENLAIFTGNVRVVQGPTLLKAGLLKVYYIKDAAAGKNGAKSTSTSASMAGPALGGSTNIDHLEVDGTVYLKSDDQVATGDRGTFDMKSQVLVLTGSKVVLTQGDNILTGCKLTVQMKSGLANVDGCAKSGSSGRVMMSISPDSTKNPDAAKKP